MNIITANQAATRYSVTNRTVLRWASHHGAPTEPREPNKPVYFNSDALAEWVSKNPWRVPRNAAHVALMRRSIEVIEILSEAAKCEQSSAALLKDLRDAVGIKERKTK